MNKNKPFQIVISLKSYRDMAQKVIYEKKQLLKNSKMYMSYGIDCVLQMCSGTNSQKLSK